MNTSKIRLMFKDPDAIGDPGVADDPVVKKFVEYGEYVTIEIDLRTGRARVLPVRRSSHKE